MDTDSTSMRVNLTLIIMASTVFVLFCLVVLCARHCRSDEHDSHSDELLYGYSIDMIDGRDALLLRENLVDTELDDGKSEWQCIVCIHMNHPDHLMCALCGASADASLHNGSVLATGGTGRAAHNSTALFATALSTNSTLLLLSSEVSSTSHAHLPSSDIPLLRSSSSAGVSAVDSVDLAAAASSARQRALRYRRLNAMQLTQKQRGAYRRRLWQRVALPNNTFVWVRTAHSALPTNALAPPTLQRSDSLLHKLRNNTFLTKNPHATTLHGAVAEQLHRKNAATMGFFTELDSDGSVAWRTTDAVIVQIDALHSAQAKLRAGSSASTTTSTHSSSAAAPLSTHSSTVAAPLSTDLTVAPNDLDFEGLMSLSFRDKKRWLLKRVATIAVPYMEALHRVTVRRGFVLQDSVVALGGYVSPQQLLQHVNVTFADEPALDAGGVLREWFGMVLKALFSAELGLFVPTHAENKAYWIHPTTVAADAHLMDAKSHLPLPKLQYYTFAGRLFGKAILEGLVVEDVNLALPLLKHFLSVPITFSDLEFLDEALYKSAMWMRDNDNVESLCLTFSVASGVGDVATDIVDLKPNGRDIDVTDENKTEYLTLLLRYKMLESVAEPLGAMLSGLYEIIPKSLLSVFDYQELDFFLSGLPVLNVRDWQTHTRVLHCADEDDTIALQHEIDVVFWFWEAVAAFTDEERARLLQFATGSARVPVEGFKALTSASGYVHTFSLQLVPLGVPPLGMCPRAHTCFNRIDLPVYATKEDLVTYLTLVLQMEITGFGFE